MVGGALRAASLVPLAGEAHQQGFSFSSTTGRVSVYSAAVTVAGQKKSPIMQFEHTCSAVSHLQAQALNSLQRVSRAWPRGACPRLKGAAMEQ